MAITYGFFNSVGHDRTYNATHFGQIFDGIIEDGVFENVGNRFQVLEGSGLSVTVDSGRCWFDRTWLTNDAIITIHTTDSDLTKPRYDAVVVEVNKTEAVRNSTIKFIQGEPAERPDYPSLQKSTLINQYPLAYVYIPALSSAIIRSNIINVVGTENCPFAISAIEPADMNILTSNFQKAWDSWFSEIEATLDDNVVGELKNLIASKVKKADVATINDVNDMRSVDKWVTPLSISKINPPSMSTGTLFSIPSSPSINLSIPRALPATGGAYSQDAYPDLYNVLGSAYGTGISANVVLATDGNGSTYHKRDGYNGNIYRYNATTVSYTIYDKKYNFVRTISSPLTSATIFYIMNVYDDVVTVFTSTASTRTFYVSTDSGVTWSVASPTVVANMAYSGSNGDAIVTKDKKYVYLSVGYSSTYQYNQSFIYNIETKTWSTSTYIASASGTAAAYRCLKMGYCDYGSGIYTIYYYGNTSLVGIGIFNSAFPTNTTIDSVPANTIDNIYIYSGVPSFVTGWDNIYQKEFFYWVNTSYIFNRVPTDFSIPAESFPTVSSSTWQRIVSVIQAADKLFIFAASNSSGQPGRYGLIQISQDFSDSNWTFLAYTTTPNSSPIEAWLNDNSIIDFIINNSGEIYSFTAANTYFKVPTIGTLSNMTWYIKT